jgi:hypothetical protein
MFVTVLVSEEALEQAHDAEARVTLQSSLLAWRYKVRITAVSCHLFSQPCCIGPCMYVTINQLASQPCMLHIQDPGMYNNIKQRTAPTVAHVHNLTTSRMPFSHLMCTSECDWYTQALMQREGKPMDPLLPQTRGTAGAVLQFGCQYWCDAA